jgi:hypothetical protein
LNNDLCKKLFLYNFFHCEWQAKKINLVAVVLMSRLFLKKMMALHKVDFVSVKITVVCSYLAYSEIDNGAVAAPIANLHLDLVM